MIFCGGFGAGGSRQKLCACTEQQWIQMARVVIGEEKTTTRVPWRRYMLYMYMYIYFLARCIALSCGPNYTFAMIYDTLSRVISINPNSHTYI